MLLTVPTGAPLRIYLTRRLPKKVGEPVHAKLLEPVFAFNREVLPAGAEVLGHVSRLAPVPKMQRAAAILNGDFTPLHRAEVVFTEIVLPDGRHMSLSTSESEGLNSVYTPPRPPKPSKKKKPDGAPSNGGVLGTAKSQVKTQIDSAINAKTRGVADIVRSPNKKEKLEDFLMAKLPYHPQWVRKGTRFDAELDRPLQFGAETVTTATLSLVGSQVPADSVVHTRLLTPLSSGDASQGDNVEAVVVQPLFSRDNKLILPAGASLSGKVTVASRARWFHRGGHLRFSFQRIELPEDVRNHLPAEPSPEFKTLATLDNAEGSGKATIKVDSEGEVKTVESKTRFIGPAIAVLIAARTMDNDAGKVRAGAADGNAGGRTLGGISGFGLLGAFAAQASHGLASALGFYGMGWSVYSTVVARGGEVEFQKNAALDIRFGARAPVAGSKFARAF
jgi:hypothetical protein